MDTGEIIIYKDNSGPQIEVNFVDDTIWLTQSQMADLFGKDIRTISEHIKNIFKTGELAKDSVIRNFRITAKDGKNYNTAHYNLDMIISVGYRVNSKRGTQFRIWATSKIRDFLLKGYVVNKNVLQSGALAKVKELEGAVRLIQLAIQNKKLEGYEKEVLDIITDYAATWTLLYQYDEQKLQPEHVVKKVTRKLDYEQVTKSIDKFRDRLLKDKQASKLFGKEQDGKLQALLGNIEQTYDGKSVYEGFEQKAAHLLYFAIKDHPFADGNKRIGSLLFILYLVENDRIYNKRGDRIINDNALTAIALLIAESSPSEKSTMVNLVASLIAKK